MLTLLYKLFPHYQQFQGLKIILAILAQDIKFLKIYTQKINLNNLNTCLVGMKFYRNPWFHINPSPILRTSAYSLQSGRVAQRDGCLQTPSMNMAVILIIICEINLRTTWNIDVQWSLNYQDPTYPDTYLGTNYLYIYIYI